MSQKSPELAVLYIIDLFHDVRFGQKEVNKKGKEIVSIRYVSHFELMRLGIYYDLWYWHIEEDQKQIRKENTKTA